jgi:hypothetical protein
VQHGLAGEFAVDQAAGDRIDLPTALHSICGRNFFRSQVRRAIAT